MSNAPANPDVVIVTGSSGNIGSAIVDALAGTYCVPGLDRKSAPRPYGQRDRGGGV